MPDFIPANENNFMVGRSWKGVNNNIDTIIIHSIVGSLDSAVRTFQDPKRPVSSHYIVGWNGRVVQMVKDEDTAYHAGNFAMNLRSIGIEHDDQGKPDIVRPDALYEASAQQVAFLCRKYGIPVDRAHIKKHSEVIPTACPAGLDIERIVKRALQINVDLLSGSQIIGEITTVSSGEGVNVRDIPKLNGNIIAALKAGDQIVIEKEVEGDKVLGNSKWYEILTTSGMDAYVWSGRLNIIQQPVNEAPVETPKQPDAEIVTVQVTKIQLNALQVIINALKTLVTKEGQPFGNEEGLARALVGEWPSYLNLIIAEKKQRSILDKIAGFFGLA